MSKKFFSVMQCLLCLLGLIACVLPAYAASFDCAKAATTAEKLICSDDELSKLDESLSNIYQHDLAQSADKQKAIKEQRQWLKVVRNACQNSECLRKAYQGRINALNGSMASVNSEADEQEIKNNSVIASNYQFQLTKGKGTEVCDAYLKRLNSTDYVVPPYCDRPETTTIAGFTQLTRVPLSPEAIHAVFPRVNKFIGLGRQGSKEEDDAFEAMLKADGVGPSIDSVSEMAEYLEHNQMKVWRYDPRVDIDNDGMPDNLLMWQGYGLDAPMGTCGNPIDTIHFATDGSQPQEAFVMNADNSRIDIPKTRAVFGHPSGGYRLSTGHMSTNFRPMGKTIGIFEYQGIYYFDTFLEYWAGDLHNRNKNYERYPTLGVFVSYPDKTRQVCEYRMTKPGIKSMENAR